MSLKNSEKELLHIEGALFNHICFLIDEGDHKALSNINTCLSGSLATSRSISEGMWEINELLIEEFDYKRCPICEWAIGVGERHFSCEDEIVKKNAPYCISCRRPVIEGEDHSYCHQQLENCELEDCDDEYMHAPCSICGSINCGGNHCDYCGSLDCEGDCCCYCVGSPGHCECNNEDPLSCEDDEHRVSVPDLIDMEEVNDD